MAQTGGVAKRVVDISLPWRFRIAAVWTPVINPGRAPTSRKKLARFSCSLRSRHQHAEPAWPETGEARNLLGQEPAGRGTCLTNI